MIPSRRPAGRRYTEGEPAQHAGSPLFAILRALRRLPAGTEIVPKRRDKGGVKSFKLYVDMGRALW